MKKVRLSLDELSVESFVAQEEKGGIVSMSESDGNGGCGTHSLNYATHCDCSGGVGCTVKCIEYSQATDIYFCCG
jgi:hypothetical protein